MISVGKHLGRRLGYRSSKPVYGTGRSTGGRRGGCRVTAVTNSCPVYGFGSGSGMAQTGVVVEYTEYDLALCERRRTWCVTDPAGCCEAGSGSGSGASGSVGSQSSGGLTGFDPPFHGDPEVCCCGTARSSLDDFLASPMHAHVTNKSGRCVCLPDCLDLIPYGAQDCSNVWRNPGVEFNGVPVLQFPACDSSPLTLRCTYSVWCQNSEGPPYEASMWNLHFACHGSIGQLAVCGSSYNVQASLLSCDPFAVHFDVEVPNSFCLVCPLGSYSLDIYAGSCHS